MIIIIKKNPAEPLKTNELLNLINPLIKGRFWQKSGLLKSFRIIEVVGPQGAFTEYHCICEITPEEITKRVVEKLNGKNFLGSLLDVHEYTVRNRENDPRQNFGVERPANEKRRSERRRSKLTTRSIHS